MVEQLFQMCRRLQWSLSVLKKKNFFLSNSLTHQFAKIFVILKLHFQYKVRVELLRGHVIFHLSDWISH